MNIVIDILNTGVVESLHFDKFDLGFLGRKEIRRASEILWDEDRQEWYLKLPGQEVETLSDLQRGFASYEVARDVEVDWLQECRMKAVQPLSANGLAVLESVRLERNI